MDFRTYPPPSRSSAWCLQPDFTLGASGSCAVPLEHSGSAMAWSLWRSLLSGYRACYPWFFRMLKWGIFGNGDSNLEKIHWNIQYWLVVWLPCFIFPEILGISSSQLTNSIIFQRGGPTTNHRGCFRADLDQLAVASLKPKGLSHERNSLVGWWIIWDLIHGDDDDNP